MWGCGPGDSHARVLGEVAQAAGGGVPVHPGAAGIEQDRPAGPLRYGAVDGPADRRGQRDQDDLGALAAHPQHAVAVFFAQVGDAAPVASKIRRPSSPSMATRAKS